MLDRIMGIAGCAFGVVGAVAAGVANKKFKNLEETVNDHIYVKHANLDENIDNKFIDMDVRLSELKNNIDDVNKKSDEYRRECLESVESHNETLNDRINKLTDRVNKEVCDLSNAINLLNKQNFDINENQKKINNNISDDIIKNKSQLKDIDNWCGAVNAAIEQLEVYVKDNDKNFDPIIKSMLDARRAKLAATVKPETVKIVKSEETPDIKTKAEAVVEPETVKPETVKPEATKPETKTTKNKKK